MLKGGPNCPLQLDVRIARLAVLAVAVVALASSEAIRNDDDERGLTNDHSSGGPAWGSHVGVPIRQRRSPVPPPKKKKPFKLGALLGLVTNQGPNSIEQILALVSA